MCVLSQGSTRCTCAQPVKEGSAEAKKGNPGDNVKYFILPIAALTVI